MTGGLDVLALYERLGEISTRLTGQDHFMDRMEKKLDGIGEDVVAVRHDHANSKQVIGLLKERVEVIQVKQDKVDAKVSGLNDKISTMLGTAATLKWFVNWGPVSAALALTIALCRDWIVGLVHKIP